MEFKLNEYHHNISDKDLLNDVARVAKALNKANLTKKEYTQNGQYGVETICRRFGSWLKVLKLCKLESNQFQLAAASSSHLYTSISNRDLLDDIIRVSKILGKESFSSREYNDLAKYSSSTVFKRFKSWNDALDKAGLQPYKQISEKRIETVSLLEEIERMWITLGRQPTVSDIKTDTQNMHLILLVAGSAVGEMHLKPLSYGLMMNKMIFRQWRVKQTRV